MAITAISVDWGVDPRIVRIISTDNLSTITTTGYGLTQAANIQALQNGNFQWLASDYVLIYYSNGEGFFTYNSTTGTFTAAPTAPGSLSNTLPSGDIFVGNGSNVATGVAMSGDATMANTGAITIANGAVTGAKMANNTVDYAQLALDVAATATVSLSSAQILGMYATPVQLLAAPGAGKLILIDSILWDLAFGTTQYAAGGAIAAQYGNSAHGAGPAASATLAAANLNGVAANGYLANASGSSVLDVTASASLNTAVYISNASAAFTTGDSTATLYIRYRVVTPA